MVTWKQLSPILREALLDLRAHEQWEFQADTNLRTISGEFKVHLANRLNDSDVPSRFRARDSGAQLKVSPYLNRNHDNSIKTSPLTGRIALDDGERVTPALIVHDPQNSKRNIIAIEIRDFLPSCRFKEVLRCKQKLLSYVGRPLNYQFGLYLEFRQDGHVAEAKLIKRRTVLDKGEANQMYLLQELAEVYSDLVDSSKAGIVNRAKDQLLAAEELIGFEDVTDELGGATESDEPTDPQLPLF